MSEVRLRAASFVTTARCNLRCSYCHVNGATSSSAPRKAAGVLLGAIAASEAGGRRIGITGGEPLLEFPLVRWIVGRAGSTGRRSWRPRIRLVTNGLLLDDEKVEFFRRHHVSVQVSCDGGRRAQELRCRGTHRSVAALLAWLAERHPEFLAGFSVAMTVTPRTAGVIAGSARWLLDRGVTTLRVAPAMGVNGWRRDDTAALDAAMGRLFKLSVACYDRHGSVPVTFFRKSLLEAAEPAPRPPRMICGAPGGSSAALDVDGRLAGCVVATRTYLPDPAPVMRPAVEAIRMGTVDEPLAEQFARMRKRAETVGVFTDRRRRYSSYGRCADCEHYERCRICPLAAAFEREWDDPFRVPDFLCAFNKVMFRYRDRFPPQLPLEWSRTPPAVGEGRHRDCSG